MSYEERAESSQNVLTKALLNIITTKRTNLCVAVDVTTTKEIIRLLPLIGPHICMLKSFVDTLLQAKKEYNFLIFEDRKFADIGSTVANQYKNGLYRIAEWADIVTVHAVPGPGIITGLKSVAKEIAAPRGILLLAEMSSAGNLCNSDYFNATTDMAEAHKDFVVGFISQSRPSSIGPDYLVLTPGVSMASTGDSMGQQYATPQNAIERGSDIIIVGRGIYGSEDAEGEAVRYKEAGYTSYESRL